MPPIHAPHPRFMLNVCIINFCIIIIILLLTSTELLHNPAQRQTNTPENQDRSDYIRETKMQNWNSDLYSII